MRTMQISKFKATCLAELDRVGRTGRPLLITRRGQPVARILPPEVAGWDRYLGAMQGRGKIVGDIVSPASAPEEWEVLR